MMDEDVVAYYSNHLQDNASVNHIPLIHEMTSYQVVKTAVWDTMCPIPGTTLLIYRRIWTNY